MSRSPSSASRNATAVVTPTAATVHLVSARTRPPSGRPEPTGSGRLDDALHYEPRAPPSQPTASARWAWRISSRVVARRPGQIHRSPEPQPVRGPELRAIALTCRFVADCGTCDLYWRHGRNARHQSATPPLRARCRNSCGGGGPQRPGPAGRLDPGQGRVGPGATAWCSGGSATACCGSAAAAAPASTGPRCRSRASTPPWPPAGWSEGLARWEDGTWRLRERAQVRGARLLLARVQRRPALVAPPMADAA